MKVAAFLAALALLAGSARAAEAPSYLGGLDPEATCTEPLATPLCAYKTWFYCRIADQPDMCSYVLGKGRRQRWGDEPWKLPLTQLMSGPLSIYGYAFVGTREVQADRFTRDQASIARKLLGSVEVMDTYSDPNDPKLAYIGSEFYAETKPGEWHIVGWTIDVEGGDGDVACEEPGSQGNEICKLRVQGLKSWVALMREQGGK